MTTVRIFGFASLLLCIGSCGKAPIPSVAEAADRVFVNGAVYTVDEQRSWATAVAVSGGRIVFVGNDENAVAYVGDGTELVDLDGQMVLPGFHDSHVHILTEVMTDDECDLLRIPTEKEVAKKLQACTQAAGHGDELWITGGGWGEWLWPDANPQKGLLDLLYPERPVYLVSSFGHAAWVNSKALEIAGIDANTEDPEAGIIERDPETGEPSGTLRETAMAMVSARIPPMTLEQRKKRVHAGIALSHAVGITAVIEPGVGPEHIDQMLAVSDDGDFNIRALASLSPIGWHAGVFGDEVFEFIAGREQWRRPNLDVDSVKIYMDGVIEYGTSPLLEPYEDSQYGSGEYFYEQEAVNEYFTKLDKLGVQVHVHAIGDAAIRRALDGFAAMREANGMSDNRHQIVHLQLIHPDDRPRFGELGVAAVFQSLWAYPDPAAMELDIPMLGEERTYQMYPIRSVQQAGGRIVGGSDYFVTDLNPLLAIETAITRQNPWSNDGGILNAEEAVDLETMIAAYTINGAYQMGLENEQGSIEVGKRADLVVLDRNLFEIPSSEISDANVIATIFDGKTVYE
ncbi:MAG: amidohydrolase [Gammaproteobacteria bacterium]|nr:amidohydrolase [Gammaproteobacteria bacterium]